MHTAKQHCLAEMQFSAIITQLITVSFHIKIYTVVVDSWHGYHNILGTNMACRRIPSNKC